MLEWSGYSSIPLDIQTEYHCNDHSFDWSNEEIVDMQQEIKIPIQLEVMPDSDYFLFDEDDEYHHLYQII
jgi:hypothetical protein